MRARVRGVHLRVAGQLLPNLTRPTIAVAGHLFQKDDQWKGLLCPLNHQMGKTYRKQK